MASLVTCPSCRGSGADVWMTTDDWRLSPLNRREQWYSESNCHDCDGAGQVTGAKAERLLADARAFGAEFEATRIARDSAGWAKAEAEQRAWSEANPLTGRALEAQADFEAKLRGWNDYCAQFPWNKRPEGAVAR